VLAASVAVLTSIEFGIDTTLRIGAICYLLLLGPALLLVRRARGIRDESGSSMREEGQPSKLDLTSVS
jgi:hypothetical protein